MRKVLGREAVWSEETFAVTQDVGRLPVPASPFSNPLAENSQAGRPLLLVFSVCVENLPR